MKIRQNRRYANISRFTTFKSENGAFIIKADESTTNSNILQTNKNKPTLLK